MVNVLSKCTSVVDKQRRVRVHIMHMTCWCAKSCVYFLKLLRT